MPFDKIRSIHVSGDSMQPRFWDGDIVFYIENRPRRIVDGVYVINRGGMLMIKQLQVISQFEISIISINPSYETIRLNLNTNDTYFQVIGKVIGRYEWFTYTIEE